MTSKPAYLQVKFGEAVWHDESYNGNPRDFYDRVSDKEKALDILLSPQTRRAIWLVGERRAGKTSMLKLLLNKCRAQERYIAIEIPWQSIHSPESFYRECLQQLDKHAGYEGCLPLPRIYTPESFWESLQSRIQRAPSKTIVVGIDELDTILYELAQSNNSWPREIVSVVFRFVEEAGFKIIVTTVKTPEEVEPLKASPLVGRSEVIRLCPFANEDIKSLVEDFIPGCPEPYLEQIRHLSGNWPYYAKALLQHLLKVAPEDTQRLEVALKEAVRSIAPTCEHVYRRHLDEEEQRALLLLAYKGSLCQEEFNRLDIQLRTAFRRLIERGYVLEEKQRFYFRVQLIGNWFQTWTHRELEGEKLGIPQLVKRLERDWDPWREEPGEILIRVTKEEMRRRGF